MDTMKTFRPKMLTTPANIIRASCLCCLVTVLATILLVVFIAIRYEKADTVDKIADLFVKLPDSGVMELALDDASVIDAMEILRQYINAYRNDNCSFLTQYDRSGIIKYAKRDALDEYSISYSIEVTFGDEAVFSRFRLLPYNETYVGERRLELLSSTPAPCNSSMQDQLAVSASGMFVVSFAFFLE